MAKGKSTWKYNKLLTARRNYFVGGGNAMQRAVAANNVGVAPEVQGMAGVYGTPNQATLPEIAEAQRDIALGAATNNNNDKEGGSNFNFGSGMAALAGAAATDISTMINNINANDVTARKNQLLNSVNSAQKKTVRNDSFDQLMADYSSTSALSNVSGKDLGAKSGGAVFGESLAAGLRGSIAGFGAGNGGFAYGGQKSNKYMGGGPIGAIIGGVMGTGTSLIGNLIRNHKAQVAANEVNNQINYTNAFNQRALDNRAFNLAGTQMANLESNYAALGGNIATHGADFSNGLMAINEGGSHEENPLDGVPIGIDPEGTPNLVEEGETIFNDYVFSKRLMVPKAIRNKYKLRGTKNISFADASKRLAKESEERPNDPISKRGLEALMSDLAGAQEELKAAQQGGRYAFGGNLFGGGGWQYNNSKNDDTMAGHELFAPFFNNGAFDFNAMHADNSAYRQRLDRLAGILWKRKQDSNYQYTDDEKKVLEGYLGNVRSWNGGKGYSGGIDELTFDKIIGESLTTTDGKTFTFNPNAKKKGLALDSMRGGHYWGAAGVDPYKIREEHMLMGKDGSLTELPEEQRYWEGRRKSDSQYWKDKYGNEIKREDEGRYTSYIDKEKGEEIRRYLYSPIEEKKPVANKYYYNIGTKDKPNYQLYEGADAPLWMANNAYNFTKEAADGDSTSYFYDKPEEYKMGKYQDWLRYAPVVGFGVGTLTDAFGLTNKPDYSNADAILEATREAGQYQPVSFNPIGNYLDYRPFDRDYYINKQNAESGAARRNVLNTSAGNRATAMAGVLAADNNYLNGIGTLARQAEEYNLGQRQLVEDFNRTTNTTNSQGKLQADMANQNALMNLGDFRLRGTMAAAEMRDRERARTDAARSANFSGLFQSIGDIGFEEANRRMVDWGIMKGLYGPGTQDYTWSGVKKADDKNTTTTTPTTPTTNKPKAKGGKIRRKKRGLTI